MHRRQHAARASLRRLRRARTEGGYAAVMVAVLVPTVFLGFAAIGVDTARWYLEAERVQAAADAAALGGVPYLPQDLPNAKARALAIAQRNGYDDADAAVQVLVSKGVRESQLRVTIVSTIDNAIGGALGLHHAAIARTAVADYTGPAPMGSPCNTFGNEPTAGGGSSPGPITSARGPSPFSNCVSNPGFWATVQGPTTDKLQGDRYQTRTCAKSTTYRCSGGSNGEYQEQGYFWIIKVEKQAVATPITVQLYDPAFVNTGATCTSLPGPSAVNLSDAMNPWVTDAKKRYSTASLGASAADMGSSCTGDYFPGGGSTLMTTSFAVRQQTDSHDPMKAAVQEDAAGRPCIRQYTGTTTAPSVDRLRAASSTYSDSLAQVFHNWTTLCTFTPQRDGEYYLQVRTNVAAGGSATANTQANAPIIYSENADVLAASGNKTTGAGNNAFGIRAVTQPNLENYVAVSGYNRMPIFVNADSAAATAETCGKGCAEFNLLRVLPGAAGQYLRFSFFDAGDATATGSVKVLPAREATGSVVSTPYPGGCKAEGGYAGTGAALPDCKATITNEEVRGNNGQVETMDVPIPSDYTCDFASLGGCWYRVQIRFNQGATVTDITTWDAEIVGDPVRLVE